MNDRIPVNETDTKTWFFLEFVGVLLASVGYYVATIQNWQESLGVLLLTGGAGLTLICTCCLAYHRLQQQWIEVTDEGFVLLNRHRRQEFRDADVENLAVAVVHAFNDGNRLSMTRRLTIGVMMASGDHQKVSITNNFPRFDPLQEFIDRLQQRLYERAKYNWAQGKAVLGEGWELNGQELRMRPGKSSQDFVTYPLRDIAAVDETEKYIRVWVRGQARAAMEIPQSANNGRLLKMMLHDYLTSHPALSPRPMEAGDLGRLLLERISYRKGFGCFTAVAFFGFFCAVLFVALRGRLNDPDAGLKFAFAYFLVGVGAVLVAVFALRTTCRFYDHGVSQTGWLVQRILPFADVTNVSFKSTTATTVNPMMIVAVSHPAALLDKDIREGAYDGIAYRFEFTPTPQCGCKPIRFTIKSRNPDPELEKIGQMIRNRIVRPPINDQS